MLLRTLGRQKSKINDEIYKMNKENYADKWDQS